MIKITKLGKAKLLDFFELVFAHTFVADGGKATVLAPSFFGGQDGDSKVHFIGQIW
jgi:hypothetical protein